MENLTPGGRISNRIPTQHCVPEKDHRLLLGQPDLQLPAQSPPRITAQGKLAAHNQICSGDLSNAFPDFEVLLSSYPQLRRMG
jgi:hypothetical protein